MSEPSCMRCVVSGRVQGVWFRASAQKKADELGLKGWVRNVPDGRVEVLACGGSKSLEAFHEWLKQGPVLAKVTDLAREDLPWQDFVSFEVR